MSSRMNIAALAPDLYQAMRGLEGAVLKSGLSKRDLHLLKLRASQINGCAFCVDMHVKEALADGLDPQMLHLVCAWRESPFFDAHDRALLEWTEAVTLVADTGIPDAAYAAAKAEFSDGDIARLVVAIGAINLWNRLAVASRMQHPLPAAA
ncbi:carboxymuconolactone decarboxylase family protein [Aquabacter sp. L1I39]|uniref:carboxymuconolactone decarboxylase family protein n=1 Tax=Aquabacter sp. L1I39 TaxID=2820278 RepID=UPI001ADCCE61|nr:carboxymuconolactone decarboxylase family protein [Aquabacter sp. L1I39]QTL03561.1 carboxymuconolactone decarboxylase family protein [Aquabacter sp. L1I39]